MKKDSTVESDNKNRRTEKATSVEDNTNMADGTNDTIIDSTTEVTIEGVTENVTGETETTTEKSEDETGDEQKDYDDSFEQGSVSVEYLNSAPTIESPIKKVPIYNTSSSLMLEEELKDETYYNYPFYMFDGDDKTSWQEGVEGVGSGESAGIYLDGVFEVKYVCFKLGNWTSDKWYNKNARPKTLTLNIDGELIDLEFPDGMEERWVKIGNAAKCDYIAVYLGEVYPGTEYEDTCINEIEFYGIWYENVEY